MHRVDSAGATPQHEFTNGNPSLQIPRTRLEAKFMNTLQRELVAVVEQTGQVLSDADDNQLSQSVVLWVTTGAEGIRALPIPNGPVLLEEIGSLRTTYVWNAASDVADDGASVLAPSSNPATGRWLCTKEMMLHKATNTSIASSTVLTLDPHLKFTASPEAWYAIEGSLRPFCASAAPDIKLNLVYPGGGGYFVQFASFDAPGAASNAIASAVGDAVIPVVQGQIQLIHVSGMLNMGQTGGTVGLRWAQNTVDAAQTQLLFGSWMRFTRLR